MFKFFQFVILLWFASFQCNAQNFTAKQLIKAWEVSDKTQTLEAEETYKDLKFNRNEDKLKILIPQLKDYIKKHGDTRLEIRLKMYEILSELELKDLFSKSDVDDVKNLFKKAISINDQQLLSELYSLYAEHLQARPEDNLFYNTQAIRIQEEIGAKYFPKLYQRYYIVSSSSYYFEDYRECIKQGNRGMQLFKDYQKNPIIFFLQSDILALSHYQINQIDSGFYHYNNIKLFLNEIQTNSNEYKKLKDNVSLDYLAIWKGVADGGIARGLILEGKYSESLPLLYSNLEISKKYNQQSDVAKTKYLLGEVYFQTGKTDKALEYWEESYQISLLADNKKTGYNALEGIIKAYKKSGKFDSAFYYSEKYNLSRESFLNSISHSKIIEVKNRVAFQEMQNSVQHAQSKIRKQQFTRNLIIGSAIFIFIIGLFSYNRYRLQQNLKFAQSEQNRMLAELQAKEMKNQVEEAKTKLEKFKEKLKKNKQLIESLRNNENQNDISELRFKTILTQEDWDEFKTQFGNVYPDYVYKLRESFPEFTPSEIRYLCLVKLNLRSDEIASALGISTSSLRVTWYRMRKKLRLPVQATPKTFLKKFEKSQLFH